MSYSCTAFGLVSYLNVSVWCVKGQISIPFHAVEVNMKPAEGESVGGSVGTDWVLVLSN